MCVCVCHCEQCVRMSVSRARLQVSILVYMHGDCMDTIMQTPLRIVRFRSLPVRLLKRQTDEKEVHEVVVLVMEGEPCIRLTSVPSAA